MEHKVVKRCNFFGIESEIFTTPYVSPDYPWLFKIRRPNGDWIRFAGIPNQCETIHSATMRVWWRCKWLSQDVFDKRYV